MQNWFRLTFLLAAVVGAAPAQVRNVGPIVVDYDGKIIPIRVSANVPELNKLALVAFGAHGRYSLVANRFAYDVRFTQTAATQVRFDITRGGSATPVAAELVSGNTPRHALLRAADRVVDLTNAAGLRGFFSARLAFIAERTGRKEVYVSDLFMGEAKQVTRDNALALTPRWSPDGTRIVYTSYFRSGFPDIFQLNLATNQRTTFVSFRGTNTGAHFSPSGQQVAMILTGEGTPEVYVSNAQGRQVSRKTRSAAVKSSPCWSPDGGRLVFAMEPGPQLYLMSANGGVPSRLPTGYSYSAEPDWSHARPNRIACTVRIPGGRFQIAVYDTMARRAEVVSQAPYDGQVPSWLADGRHLVYTRRDRTSSVLHLLDTETGKSTAISPRAWRAMEANVWNP